MASEEDSSPTPDDRWSAYKDPFKSSSLGTRLTEEPGPDLSEYIERVMEQRSPRKRHERMYKIVSHIVHLITGLAQALTSEWKLFLQTDKKNEIRTTPVRALTVDQYECMVPLRIPLKPDAFHLVQKGYSEMLPHQYHIKINPSLSKEEALLVRREWGPQVNKHGALETTGILDWFNNGISKACCILMAESKNISVIRCETMQDGTITVHLTISDTLKEKESGNECPSREEPPCADVFSINIFPVFTVHSLCLPTNFRVSSPLPASGSYIHVQKNLKETLLKDLDDGKQIVFLEPKRDAPSSPLKCVVPPDASLWRLNVSLTEQYVYQILDKYCTETDYRQVLVLMKVIREQFPSELGILNDEILVNTMFITSQQKFTKLVVLHDWFLELVKIICKGLNSGFLPSFYLPRQNLLACFCISEADKKVALKKLEEILSSTKEDSKSIFRFTGYVEKKKNKPETDSSEEDSDTQSDNEEDRDKVQGEAEETND